MILANPKTFQDLQNVINMNNNNLDGFSCEELKEIVQELQFELEYEKTTNQISNEEYQVVKKELYSLVSKFNKVEENLKEIELILQSNKSCSGKIGAITSLLGGVTRV